LISSRITLIDGSGAWGSVPGEQARPRCILFFILSRTRTSTERIWRVCGERQKDVSDRSSPSQQWKPE